MELEQAIAELTVCIIGNVFSMCGLMFVCYQIGAKDSARELLKQLKDDLKSLEKRHRLMAETHHRNSEMVDDWEE